MEPFQTVTGIVCPLDRTNVDTDQIIPKQFLKRVTRQGFGQFLFYNWRFDASGAARTDFILNQPAYAGASILVAGENFGCGSSREHAPWALQDYGFKVIIAPSFADIFYNNCQKNGLLTIKLAADKVRVLIDKAAKGFKLTVDLENQSLSGEDFQESFEMNPYQKQLLLQGQDEIAITMTYADAIEAYEQAHAIG
ncbi:MAG: 3-isopropylmalate dehydratase small subunit [Sporolactobacillus sp.]